MSSPSPAVPTGNRFSTTTPDDHSGIVLTITLLFGVYSCLALAVRCYLKRKNLGVDDLACFVATVKKTFDPRYDPDIASDVF